MSCNGRQCKYLKQHCSELQLIDIDPQQKQLKQNLLQMQLLELGELTPAQLFIALQRPVHITVDFQEEFEVSILLPTEVLAKQSIKNEILTK